MINYYEIFGIDPKISEEELLDIIRKGIERNEKNVQRYEGRELTNCKIK